jgi:hypothetical protein
MIPYIAALIILIAVILYQVYAKTESFANDASGNAIDASGNEIKLSLSDLYGLLGPFKTGDASGNTVVKGDASGNTIKAAAPADVVTTGLSAQEITDRLAKAVSKQVKDDLISQHALDDIHDRYAPCDLTNSEAQGQEYVDHRPAPPPSPSSQPDMSEYIRKDSIPCWNCAVP